MISVTVQGDFRHMMEFHKKVVQRSYFKALTKYGPMGVAALKQATPEDSGETANDWYYKLVDEPTYFAIQWLNSNIVDPGRIPVAILIQYGHATRQGGHVVGRDYINPAMRVIFDRMAADMWREVTR